jgi:hypothetical protein
MNGTLSIDAVGSVNFRSNTPHKFLPDVIDGPYSNVCTPPVDRLRVKFDQALY